MAENIFGSSGLLIGPDLLKVTSILFGPSDILGGDIEIPEAGLWPELNLYPSTNLFPSGSETVLLYPQDALFLTNKTYPTYNDIYA